MAKAEWIKRMTIQDAIAPYTRKLCMSHYYRVALWLWLSVWAIHMVFKNLLGWRRLCIKKKKQLETAPMTLHGRSVVEEGQH